MRLNSIGGRSRAVRVLFLASAMVGATTARSAFAAEGSPAARYIPREDLVAYLEFSGLAAHQAAWEKTALAKMLNETTCGAMIEKIVASWIKSAASSLPESKQSLAKAAEIGKRFLKSGYVLGLVGRPVEGEASMIAVFPGLAAGETLADVRAALEGLSRSSGRAEVETREDGRSITVSATGSGGKLSWWIEKSDVVVVFGKSNRAVDDVISALSGKTPSAMDAPIRKRLVAGDAKFDSVSVGFIDLSSIPPTPPFLGLSGLKRVEMKWGFQGDALASETRVIAPAPRRGLLGILNQPTFDATTLPPLPKDADGFMVVSVDGLKLFDEIVAIAAAADPRADAHVKQMLEHVERQAGIRVREDFLGLLGPKTAFYVAPQKVQAPISPYDGMLTWLWHLPKFTMIMEVRKEAEFAKTLDKLATLANQAMKAAAANRPAPEFRRLTGGKGYVLHVPPALAPMPAGLRPTFLLQSGYFVFAISPEDARKAASYPKGSIQNRFEDPAMRKAMAGLPSGMTMLAVGDPRESIPGFIANLPFFSGLIGTFAGADNPAIREAFLVDIDPEQIPSIDKMKSYLFPGAASVAIDSEGLTISTRESVPQLNMISASPVAIALLLPAVQSARMAAKRAQSVNNIKQIMLALHNYHDAKGSFPAPATVDGDGKPLLSWRVAILPYLEQNQLYEEFKLDEPWNSEHNSKLIERMPDVFKSTNLQPSDPFATFYQTLVGEGAFADRTKGTKITEILDGTSNTIAVVEAGVAVPWTKPADLPYDLEKLPKFGGLGWPGGFNVGFADGSVRFISSKIKEQVLRALITKAGGEVVVVDDL